MPVLSWMRNDFQISAVMVNIKNHHLTQMKLAYISRYFLVRSMKLENSYSLRSNILLKKKSHTIIHLENGSDFAMKNYKYKKQCHKQHQVWSITAQAALLPFELVSYKNVILTLADGAHQYKSFIALCLTSSKKQYSGKLPRFMHIIASVSEHNIYFNCVSNDNFCTCLPSHK